MGLKESTELKRARKAVDRVQKQMLLKMRASLPYKQWLEEFAPYIPKRKK